MNNFQQLWRRYTAKVPPYLKNRYVLVALAFGLWMLWPDRYNVWNQMYLGQTQSKLEEEKAFFEQRIHEVREDRQELFSDDESIEKFARERYFMKRPNEDVFVIERVGEGSVADSDKEAQ